MATINNGSNSSGKKKYERIERGKEPRRVKFTAARNAKKQVEDAARVDKEIQRHGIKPSSVAAYLKQKGIPYGSAASIISDLRPQNPDRAKVRDELLKQLKSHSDKFKRVVKIIKR
jgi:hypothetical protein